MAYDCMPIGDTALTVQFDPVISEKVNRQVHRLHKTLEKRFVKGIIEMVPAYASLLIYYDPTVLPYQRLMAEIEACHSTSYTEVATERRVWLPALYGGSYGPDLLDVARLNGLTPDEVISLHSGTEYRVYMLGFSPGFPYLGGLPDSLHTPRLAEPRKVVPRGSIGIAGSQTGIYSLDTPGGWRIIAHTPVPLFQREKDKPFLLGASDLVRFVPVQLAEYFEICNAVDNGTYQVKEVVECEST